MLDRLAFTREGQIVTGLVELAFLAAALFALGRHLSRTTPTS